MSHRVIRFNEIYGVKLEFLKLTGLFIQFQSSLSLFMVGSALLLIATSDCQQTKHDDRFKKAVVYWTETLCILQKTQTLAFHGIFANSTETLRDFFDVVLHRTVEYCSAIVLLNVHTLPNFDQDPGSNVTNSNTGRDNANGGEHTGLEKSNAITGHGIRRSVSALNILHHKWNVKRGWTKNDEYLIDLRTVNIIFLEDNDSFEKLLDSSTPFKWSKGEHFIVLAVWNDRLAKLRDKRPLIDRTLRKLWLEHRIQNVFFGEPLSGRGDFHFYSYNPFRANNDGGWGLLEGVDGSSKKRMLRSLSTLTYRRAVNFNGYEFNVSMFDQDQEGTKVQGEIDPNSIYVYSGGYRGPSGTLLGVLAKKLNFNANVIEPSTKEKYGHQMENGTFSGAVGDVAYRRVVASFASFFVKKYADDMSGTEFTATLGFDQVCVIAPKAAEIPKCLRVFYIFELNVWLCMILSYIMVYVTWHYVEVYSSLWSKSVRRRSTHLRIFHVCTGYPISLPSTISERCLLIGIFFCGITLVGIFNGTLYTSFATDMFYKDIDDLAELDASRLPIGFLSYSTTDLFGARDEPDLSPVLKSLQRKMVHVSNPVKVVAFHRNVSALLRDQYFTLIRESLIDKSGNYMLHRVNECPARFYLACLLPDNSFLRERINIMIGRLNEAGLPTLWRTRTIMQNALKMKVNIHKDYKFKKPSFVPFQLSDLQISFFILGTGLLSSTIAFFTEKGWISLCFKRKRNRAQ